MGQYLANLLIGWRISDSASKVVANIQMLRKEEGAHLALAVALYRATLLNVHIPEGFVTAHEVLERPTAFRKELCYAAYSLLKDIRQTSRDKLQSYASFNITPDSVVVEHTNICDLALSLLMSTVGVGYKQSTFNAVKYAWKDVTAFSPTEEDLIVFMTMPEYIENDVIQQPLETDQWLELARTLPSFIMPDPYGGQ